MTNEKCIICGEHAWYYQQNHVSRTGPYCPEHNRELRGFLEMKKDELVKEHWNSWVDEFQNEKEELK